MATECGSRKHRPEKHYTGSDSRGSAGCIWGGYDGRFSVVCVEVEGWEILRRQPHWRESSGGCGVCQDRQARNCAQSSSMGILSLGRRLQLQRNVQPSAEIWEGQVKWTLRTLQSLLCRERPWEVHNGAQKANWGWGWGGEWSVSVIGKGMSPCYLFSMQLSYFLYHCNTIINTHTHACTCIHTCKWALCTWCVQTGLSKESGLGWKQRQSDLRKQTPERNWRAGRSLMAVRMEPVIHPLQLLLDLG